MNAHLHHPVVPPRRLHHRAPLGDDERERLLDVDILAGRARVDHLQRMPVVGRVDDDGVDVGPFEERGSRGSGRRAAGLRRGEGHVRRVDVAERRHLDVLVGEERVEHLVAAVAEADEADAHAIVGAEHAAASHGRRHPGGRGSLVRTAVG